MYIYWIVFASLNVALSVSLDGKSIFGQQLDAINHNGKNYDKLTPFIKYLKRTNHLLMKEMVLRMGSFETENSVENTDKRLNPVGRYSRGKQVNKRHANRNRGRHRNRQRKNNGRSYSESSSHRFQFPSSFGNNVVVEPMPNLSTDSRPSDIVRFDRSQIKNQDAKKRVRKAELYVEFLVRDSVQSTSASRRHGRLNRARGNSSRKDIKITLMLAIRAQNGELQIVDRGKHWGYRDLNPLEAGINRQGRISSSSVIKRFHFDVTDLGKIDSSAVENYTEDSQPSQSRILPRLKYWTLPEIKLLAFCRRKKHIVPCASRRVTIYGQPYLTLRTTTDNFKASQ